jgi:hypothetical protein
MPFGFEDANSSHPYQQISFQTWFAELVPKSVANSLKTLESLLDDEEKYDTDRYVRRNVSRSYEIAGHDSEWQLFAKTLGIIYDELRQQETTEEYEIYNKGLSTYEKRLATLIEDLVGDDVFFTNDYGEGFLSLFGRMYRDEFSSPGCTTLPGLANELALWR